jgi:pre-mRNA-splicing factor SYF1
VKKRNRDKNMSTNSHEITIKQIANALIQSDEDFEYEERISTNPYDLKTWLQYIQRKQNMLASSSSSISQSYNAINYLYERALHVLPHSYKLWFNYLQVRVQQVQNVSLKHFHLWDSVNTCFEKSLVTMHKMPRIWNEYIRFLIRQECVTQTRTVCDRALLSLPITQHHLIWDLYIKFAKRKELVPVVTAVSIFKRYLLVSVIILF